MNLKRRQVYFGAICLIAGTLVHFAYEASNRNILVGALCAANESVFEHLKLLSTPLLLLGVVEYLLYGRKVRNFIPVKVASALIGMTVILGLFYTYTSITGADNLIADIAIFVLGVTAAYAFSGALLGKKAFSSRAAVIGGWIGLVLLIGAFLLGTFCPPQMELFRDPVTGGFGLPASLR